ncbi:uncharacterized protein K452DRAFT_303265 [Aplosporella prunicola CBS 121167]|uniref:Heterokaryon incompatibility domain-containing protein n=1 Tax=Aplosporella prunicola CBS 121167 TaxID=1176127 RepID=A0A6A6AVW6_9PEZI|nr:uncharacterized protein K452DRAFT_303265 [Aplosporella prunicola CBS 121167]KAF2135840.1 hypothetical protein K452DRAFT_303265 [Aplosporella prunicola CBS 121167]
MDSVYGFAEVTIVGATGDSTHGLSRIRTHRELRQIQGEVKPGICLALQFPGFDKKEKALSRWTTRAWTLQEALLSPRLVIFHNDFMTWECREAVWCEDVVPGANACFIQPHVGSRMLPLLPERLEAAKDDTYSVLISPICSVDDLTMYENVVREYSNRQITVQAEKLNAFTGISSVFGSHMETDFFYGLPRSHLDMSLLWWAAEPLQRLPEFPSWSWAGWEGAVCAQIQQTTRLKRLVQAWEDPGYVAPKRPWRIAPGKALENTPNVHHALTKVIDFGPTGRTLGRCLCFQAFCTSGISFTFHDQVVIDQDGKIVGGIVFDNPTFLEIERNKLELKA